MKFPGKMVAEVLKHVLKKPATTAYPAEKAEMPDQYRGQIEYHAEKCNGCKLCMKDCPSAAITINKVGDKLFEAIFDLDRCIYCAQCADSCNKDALMSTKVFELAQLERGKFKVVFHAKPKPEAKPAEPKPESSATGESGGASGSSSGSAPQPAGT